MNQQYVAAEPSRAQLDALTGPAVVEFGTPWCGHCRAAQALLARAFTDHPGVPHIKVEDGSGRRLGRSFGVKLWPTLIFLRDGKETMRLVRPREAGLIGQALAQISTASQSQSPTP